MVKKEWTLSIKWLKISSILYLVLPFIIFLLGFFKSFFSIPVSVILLWITWRICRSFKDEQEQGKRRDLFTFLLVLLLWVGLAGIGGYAFQNFDFNARNAVFRDLINYQWPVFYPSMDTGGSQYALVYYFGYWLIPALIGKLVGWQLANFILYLYSAVGIFFVIVLLARLMKTTLTKAILLMVFFSGMDFLIVLLKHSMFPDYYPYIWPPIAHLEWWGTFQFSAFTTQLFWVFNQAIPTWVCTALFLNSKDKKISVFLLGLNVFFAPLPALGFAFLIFARVLNDLLNPTEKKQGKLLSQLWERSKDLFTIENILGGGIIGITSFFFMFTNQSKSFVDQTQISAWIILDIFLCILFEWLLLWFLLREKRKTDITWYLMAAFFIIVLFTTISGSYLLSKRSTIAPLMLLMVWVGEALQKKEFKYRSALLLLLVIGAATSVYEINRSVYRTFQYYTQPRSNTTVVIPTKSNQIERRTFPANPEFDHPETIIADDYYSLSTFDPIYLTNYVADIEGSEFFKLFYK